MAPIPRMALFHEERVLDELEAFAVDAPITSKRTLLSKQWYRIIERNHRNGWARSMWLPKRGGASFSWRSRRGTQESFGEAICAIDK